MRRREVVVPEPQVEVQAELMAEAFGFYAENVLTRDHFNEVLNARFAEQGLALQQRFGNLQRLQHLTAWMLGIMFAVLVIPQLHAWFC